MPGGLDLLLLRPDLDGLLVDELLQLVLRGDQLVVLHGARLGGHGVEDGGHGLAADDGGGQRRGGLHQLGLREKKYYEENSSKGEKLHPNVKFSG